MLWKWKDKSLPDLYSIPVEELANILPRKITSENRKVSLALEGIKQRLTYLQEVGLGYLTLDRSTKTLSGGETQRVNLTTCLGSALTDAMFALDEPTIGLHGKDIGNLIKPFQIDNWWLIIKLLEKREASLDQNTSKQMALELCEIFVHDKVNELIKNNFRNL